MRLALVVEAVNGVLDGEVESVGIGEVKWTPPAGPLVPGY